LNASFAPNSSLDFIYSYHKIIKGTHDCFAIP